MKTYCGSTVAKEMEDEFSAVRYCKPDNLLAKLETLKDSIEKGCLDSILRVKGVLLVWEIMGESKRFVKPQSLHLIPTEGVKPKSKVIGETLNRYAHKWDKL